MSYKGFQERRPSFSTSLTGQHWIFLKNGVDDFRDGFPPPDNMLVSGRKQPVSITLENSTPKSLSRAPRKKRNQCSGAQILRKVAGVLGPDMILKSKAGYSDYEQENQPGEGVLGHMEDIQSKVTASKTQVQQVQHKLPKKSAARIKEATLTELVPSDEQGGGNWNIDEDALMRLLNTSCEREATDPSLFNAVKFINMETKQLKSQDISPPQLAVRSSHYLRSLPCQVMVPSQTKWEKIRYGAWYLDPKTWRKQNANEHQKNQRPQSIALGVRRTGLKSYCESQKLHHSSMT